MEILSRLRIKDLESINAVMLQDGTEKIPMTMDTLLNPVYFDGLIESGYIFCGLPHDFRKDGKKLEDLQLIDIQLTDNELQELMDLEGSRYSDEELRSKLTRPPESAFNFNKGEYTIHTRKELEEYLDMGSLYKIDSDFLPLNYFVAPEALYTWEEIRSADPRIQHYMNIIDSRRVMPYRKFMLLLNWCHEKGLPEQFDSQDFVDFYFQWGIDGVNIDFISKSRVEVRGFISDVYNQGSRNVKENYEIGLIDNLGQVTMTEEAERGHYTLAFSDKESQRSFCSQIPDGEVRAVKLKTDVVVYATELISPDVKVRYTADQLVLGSFTHRCFNIRSLDLTASNVAPYYWHTDKAVEYSYLKSMTQELLNRCVVPCTASSFKALTLSGCSPKDALLYYMAVANLNKTSAMDDVEPVNVSDIYAYCRGDQINDATKDVLDNFVEGVTNIDGIYIGDMEAWKFDSTNIFNSLQAANRIMGISLDDIYESIKSLGDEKSLVLKGNGLTLRIELPVLNKKFTNFGKDILRYRDIAARSASQYIYVRTIVSEIGTESANRHFGFEGLRIASKDSAVIQAALRQVWEERITSNITDIYQREALLDSIDFYIIRSMFEIYISRQLKWWDSLGGGVQTEFPFRYEDLVKIVKPVAESTGAYCNTQIYKGTFDYCCVNAYITPFYVIPTAGKIPVIPFTYAWTDWNRSNVSDAVRAKLTEKGLYDPNYVCWNDKYMGCRLVDDTMSLGNPFNPVDYYKDSIDFFKQATEYDEVIAAPHPMEIAAPGIYPATEYIQHNYPVRDAGTKAKPSVPALKYVTKDDFKSYLSIESETSALDAVGFKEFKGFTAEDFYMHDSFLYSMFVERATPIAINDSTHFVVDGVKHDYTDLPNFVSDKYAIYPLYGRKYIVRDMGMKLWEVIV